MICPKGDTSSGEKALRKPAPKGRSVNELRVHSVASAASEMLAAVGPCAWTERFEGPTVLTAAGRSPARLLLGKWRWWPCVDSSFDEDGWRLGAHHRRRGGIRDTVMVSVGASVEGHRLEPRSNTP